MREIKFRAWNNENKFMVDSGIVSADITGYSRSKIHEMMQFTGLTDMNGKEIYEGDIMRDRFMSNPGFGQIGFGSSFDRELTTEVKVPEIYMHWDEHQFPDFEDLKKHFAEGDKEYGVEVIGNIYENPELLKEKNND